MPTDTIKQVAKEARGAAGHFADQGQRAVTDAIDAAESMLADAAKTAERVLRDGVQSLRSYTRDHAGAAGHSVEDAQRYVIQQVKERPMTATLVGLGAGLLVGLLLSSRNR